MDSIVDPAVGIAGDLALRDFANAEWQNWTSSIQIMTFELATRIGVPMGGLEDDVRTVVRPGITAGSNRTGVAPHIHWPPPHTPRSSYSPSSSTSPRRWGRWSTSSYCTT